MLACVDTRGIGARVEFDLLAIIVTPGIGSRVEYTLLEASIVISWGGFSHRWTQTDAKHVLGNGIGSNVKLDSLASIIASGSGSPWSNSSQLQASS